MKYCSLLTIIVCLIFINGCASEEKHEEKVYNNCRITKYYSSGDTSKTSTRFYYDNFGKLVAIIQPGPNDVPLGRQITYDANRVKVLDLQYADGYTLYFLGSDSLAYASSNYQLGILTDTVNYYYENGLLKKAVRNNSESGKDSSFLTYSGNDLVQIKTYMNNGTIQQASYTYTDDPAKTWYYKNFAPYVHFDIFYPWFGKANDHLVKTYSHTYNRDTTPVKLTYKLNKSGYVSWLSVLLNGKNIPGSYEYNCQ